MLINDCAYHKIERAQNNKIVNWKVYDRQLSENCNLLSFVTGKWNSSQLHNNKEASEIKYKLLGIANRNLWNNGSVQCWPRGQLSVGKNTVSFRYIEKNTTLQNFVLLNLSLF